MPVFELELPQFVTYSGYTISCIVNNLPTGVTITSGMALLKRKPDDLDADALVTKIITPVLTVGVGQVTDPGTLGTGMGVFIFTGTDTALANPAQHLRYELGIKFYFSTGEPLTFAHCFVKPIQGIVQAFT